MRIALKLPESGSQPLGRPRCPHCRSSNTRIYERTTKSVKHPDLSSVSVVRRRCQRCEKTFRHYAPGVSRSAQTVTVRALNALLYAIGFSYSQIVTLLNGCGVKLVKSTVWRGVNPVSKEACYIHTHTLKGQARVNGIATNLLKERQGEQIHLVEDLVSGQRLNIEFPDTQQGKALAAALVSMAEKLGVQSITQRMAAEAKNPDKSEDFQKAAHISPMKKAVKGRCKQLTREAERMLKEAGRRETETLEELLADCNTILDIVEGREDTYEAKSWEIYKRYAWASAPRKGEKASLWYRMRLFTLSFWDKWSKSVVKSGSSRDR